MNRNIIIAAIAAVVLLGGGAALLLANSGDDTNSNQTSQNQQDTQQPSTQTNEETTMEGNLQTLRSDGTPRECTMSYSDSSGSGSGKMYSDGKGRGLMTLNLTTARGNTGVSNTLITNDKVYSWTKTDSGSFGLVFDASTVKAGSTGSPTTSSTQTAGKNFDLKCKNWTVDESVLAVPSDVKFTSTSNPS